MSIFTSMYALLVCLPLPLEPSRDAAFNNKVLQFSTHEFSQSKLDFVFDMNLNLFYATIIVLSVFSVEGVITVSKQEDLVKVLNAELVSKQKSRAVTAINYVQNMKFTSCSHSY